MHGRMLIKSSSLALFIGRGPEWMGTRDAIPTLEGLPLFLGFTFTSCHVSRGFRLFLYLNEKGWDLSTSQPLNLPPVYFIPIFGFLSIHNQFLETFDVDEVLCPHFFDYKGIFTACITHKVIPVTGHIDMLRSSFSRLNDSKISIVW